ncbi:MAG: hypothetical protein WD512_17760 [Candidatus Paceibacterota bacterium]
MSIETGVNLGNRAEKGAEVSEGQDLEKEVTPEQMEEAKRVVLESLGMGEEVSLDNFEATQSLERYQEIEQRLEGVNSQDLH